jgi:iron complex transport system substrate-binding protein
MQMALWLYFKKTFFLLLAFSLFACKNGEKQQSNTDLPSGKEVLVEHAQAFEITDYGDFKILKVRDPWPDAEKDFVYLLTEKNAQIPENLEYDERVEIPVDEIVVTSTTHIPSLEALDETSTLVGFPGLDFISSKKTRKRIEAGKVSELGSNKSLNTEILLELKPDVVVGFAVNGQNKAFDIVKKSGVPVVYNSDWMEKHPLGKAEWVKFFGAFYNKIPEATAVFEQIKKNYRETKKLVEKLDEKPKVLAGSMFKDQWYVPYGNSWQANFIASAGGDYIYKNTRGNGSMELSFEKVFANAAHADIWVAPGGFTSYKQLLESSEHYKKFKAFQDREIYTYAKTKGETGGVLYYELAPSRPDLVLKDLIKIFHPDLLPKYETMFFKPLD